MPLTIQRTAGTGTNPQTTGGLSISRLNPATPSATPQPTPRVFPQASLVQPTQPKPNFLQQAGSAIGGVVNNAVKSWQQAPVVGGMAKQVIDFLPQAPSYAKQAVTKPGTTIAGAGEATLTAFSSLAGAVEHGIASVTKTNIPERWDISKQTQALKQLDETLLKGTDEKKAFESGRFIGAFLPYTVASEITAASVGSKLLAPIASKFLPGAIKFIPTINNAIGFLGIGQIEHDPQNGSRVDQMKNDLLMLAMFEVGGVVLKGITRSTKNAISKVVNEVKGKPKIDFETVQPQVQAVKEAIKADTGKTPEVITAETMATGKPPTQPLAGEAGGVKSGQTIETPATVKPNGKESIKQAQIPQETKPTEGQTPQVQGGKAEVKAVEGQVPQKPIGEGEVKVSKLGLRVEQTAIEKKLTSELSDLPEYKQLNMKEQAQKASDLLNSDPEKAMRVALGQELPPEGLAKESVFKALESSITTPEMASKLATSPLVSEATALGQRIKALDVKVSDSPVEAIRQVIDARAKALEKRLGRKPEQLVEKTTKDIKSKVKVPDKYDWGKFLESIKC